MSDIREWSPIAIQNSDPSPDGYPEGMLPGGVNNSDRETMASIRRKWEDADWFDWGHTITYVSPTQFSIPGDVTAIYHVDRRVRAVMPVAGTVYGRVIAQEFVTNTTVTVLWDSGQLVLETGIQVSVGVQIANAASTSLPMYWIQNTFGLLDPDILCYQNKNAVDIDGGDIAKEVVLESLPNVQNQVANPTHEELNALVGLDTVQTLEARLRVLEAATPVGTITPYASTDLTEFAGTDGEWRLCDGAPLSTTTYAVLFGLIGYAYGGSGGSFNLPDLRARVPVGHDVGNASGRLTGYRQGVDASVLGGVGGEESHEPVAGEMFAHNHGAAGNHTHDLNLSGFGGENFGLVNVESPPDRDTIIAVAPGDLYMETDGNHAHATEGASEAFNVVQPSQVINYVIRVL